MRRITIIIAMLALAACGAAEASEPAQAGPIQITTVDYAFEGLPETVAPGEELAITNGSNIEVHEVVAIRLPAEEVRTVEELVADPEALAAYFPMVSAVVIAPPGETGFPVVGDGTLTEPGRYVLVCAIPTGANPQEYLAAAAEAEGGPPDVAGGPPHLVHGMYAELTVAE